MPSADLKEQNRLAIERFIRQLAAADRSATALGEAARWGRLDLVQELLAGGVAVDARTEAGGTPLMLAASGGQAAVVQFLLGAGADANAAGDANGMTPLISCLAARHPKRVYLAVCKLLLAAGASASLGVRDTSGRTALDWANDGRPPEVVALIDAHSRAEPGAAPDTGRR